jgi:hypothetical protein
MNERNEALRQEALSEGEYLSEAIFEYASNHGAEDTESAWILSPFDSWERNPHYEGPEVPHPEYDGYEDEGDDNEDIIF